jgi:hypothetical protein
VLPGLQTVELVSGLFGARSRIPRLVLHQRLRTSGGRILRGHDILRPRSRKRAVDGFAEADRSWEGWGEWFDSPPGTAHSVRQRAGTATVLADRRAEPPRASRRNPRPPGCPKTAAGWRRTSSWVAFRVARTWCAFDPEQRRGCSGGGPPMEPEQSVKPTRTGRTKRSWPSPQKVVDCLDRR